MKRILLADDHPVVRTGLRSVLSQEAGWAIVGEAADAEQLEALLAEQDCDPGSTTSKGLQLQLLRKNASGTYVVQNMASARAH